MPPPPTTCHPVLLSSVVGSRGLQVRFHLQTGAQVEAAASAPLRGPQPWQHAAHTGAPHTQLPPPQGSPGQTTWDTVCLGHSGLSYQKIKLKTTIPDDCLLTLSHNPTCEQSGYSILNELRRQLKCRRTAAQLLKTQLMNFKFHSSPWEGDLLTHLYTSSVARAASGLRSVPKAVHVSCGVSPERAASSPLAPTGSPD